MICKIIKNNNLINLSQLSNHFEKATSQQNGEALVALATVKQVRDFLCGSLKLKNAVLTQTIHPATIQVDFYFFEFKIN